MLFILNGSKGRSPSAIVFSWSGTLYAPVHHMPWLRNEKEHDVTLYTINIVKKNIQIGASL